MFLMMRRETMGPGPTDNGWREPPARSKLVAASVARLTMSTIYGRSLARVAGVAGALLSLIALVISVEARDVHVPGNMEPGPSAMFLLVMLSFVLLGMIVALRRPGNLVGWTLMGIGIAWQLNSIGGIARIAALGSSAAEPPPWAAWAWDVLWIPGMVLVPLLFFVFPTGGLPSRRWRWALVLLGLSAGLLFLAVGLGPGLLTNTPVMNPLGVTALGPFTGVLESAGNLGFVTAAIAASATPFVRYRRASAAERYQLKWFLIAVVLVISGWTLGSFLEFAGVDASVLSAVRTAPLVAIPAATTVAILRHRLYDIDLVLTRGLAYASLAILIGSMYLGIVVGVGAIVGWSQTNSVPLAVAATAVAAIAFQPARQTLQSLANHAVYGRSANPYDVLSNFTARMAGACAAGDAPAAIATTVGGALPIASCDVWLYGPGKLLHVASWPRSRIETPSIELPDCNLVAYLPNADRIYPVRHGDRLLGVITVQEQAGSPLLSREERLLRDLAAAAWLVLDNARLTAELRASRQRLVVAQDTQRRRIEQDLHDGAQQRLLELALTLRQAQEKGRELGDATITGTITTAEIQLRTALVELRELARGIYPAILTERGLAAALQSLADRAPMPVTVIEDGAGRLPGPIEATAYFTAAEALANVIKHAAASTVAVRVTMPGDRLELTVEDNGVGGADVEAPGLSGLADRIAAVGGYLVVTSPRGSGTCVKVVLPCE
jgi:signal transduction histidine kinase